MDPTGPPDGVYFSLRNSSDLLLEFWRQVGVTLHSKVSRKWKACVFEFERLVLARATFWRCIPRGEPRLLAKHTPSDATYLKRLVQANHNIVLHANDAESMHLVLASRGITYGRRRCRQPMPGTAITKVRSAHRSWTLWRLPNKKRNDHMSIQPMQ